MWTRVQLKDKAKQALKNNYWKIILVSLLVGLIGGGTATGVTNVLESDSGSSWESELDNEIKGELDIYEDEFDNGFSSGDIGGISTIGVAGFLIIFGIVFLFVLAIALVVGFVYSAFIYNPLGVGTSRFFFQSLNEKAEVKELAFAFDHNYKNVVKILFIRDIKILLWSLLFIIPGIIKGYEYYMMPYLLAENPNLTKDEAFRLSKQMMSGNKFETFVLELSFIWWDVLSAMTAGVVGIFYVQPYKNLTFAALYEELSAINGYPARAARVQSENSYVQSDYFSQTEEQPKYTEDYSVSEEEQNEL